MRSFLPCHVLAMGKVVMVSWEPAVPAKVSSSGHNHRESDMGGKLSKPRANICILRAFPSIGEC